MQGRLGIYDKRPYKPQKTDPAISGVKEQAIKMRFNGGNKQQERMIKVLWIEQFGILIRLQKWCVPRQNTRNQ